MLRNIKFHKATTNHIIEDGTLSGNEYKISRLKTELQSIGNLWNRG